MNNAVVLFMENKSFQLSTELNLPNTIASQTLLPPKHYCRACKGIFLSVFFNSKNLRREMFIQVINILAGVRNYSYLDLLQKPS